MTSGEIDPAAVLAALNVRAAGPLERVTGGLDTAIWRFPTADGAWHALRVFRPEQATAAQREQAAIAAARAGRVPVPAIEASGVWHNRPAVVLSWSPGRPLLAVLEKAPWDLWRLGRRFGRMQARIHATPAPDRLREAPYAWITKSPYTDPALIERLRTAQGAADTFLHMDYHPLNVLSDGRRLTAVLDWVGVATGDRRADLAFTTAVLEIAPTPPGPPAPVRYVLQIARRLLTVAWRRGYDQAAGPGARDGIAPFMVWAGARLLHDFERRLGEPQMWATDRDLDPLRGWIARWRERI